MSPLEKDEGANHPDEGINHDSEIDYDNIVDLLSTLRNLFPPDRQKSDGF